MFLDSIEHLLDAEVFGRLGAGGGVKITGTDELSNVYFTSAFSKGDPLVVKSGWVTAPSSLTTATFDGVKSVHIDPSDTFISVACESSPYFRIYKRSGSSLSQVFSNTSTGAGWCARFSPNGKYVAMGFWNSPYFSVNKFNNGTLTAVSHSPALPGPTTWVDFDPTSTYMAVAHAGEPFFSVFKVDGNGNWNKLANPNVTPTNTAYGVAFDPSGTYIAVVHYGEPYFAWYKRTGDTLTKLENPNVMPSGQGTCCAWDITGTYLAVGSDTSPYLLIYKRSGDTLTKLANPSSLPSYVVNGVTFSPDGQFLYVSHRPFVSIYKVGSTFNKVETPSTLAVGNVGYGVAFGTLDNKYLVYVYRNAISGAASTLRLLQGYDWKDYAAYSTGNSVSKLKAHVNTNSELKAVAVGVALEDGAAGSYKKVLRIWK